MRDQRREVSGMKRGIVGIGAAVLIIIGLGTASAINCKQVNKYLETGRSVSDIAETMVVSEDEVKKCQEEAAAAKAAEGQGKGESAGSEEKK
jgi:hypothetical protein